MSRNIIIVFWLILGLLCLLVSCGRSEPKQKPLSKAIDKIKIPGSDEEYYGDAGSSSGSASSDSGSVGNAAVDEGADSYITPEDKAYAKKLFAKQTYDPKGPGKDAIEVSVVEKSKPVEVLKIVKIPTKEGLKDVEVKTLIITIKVKIVNKSSYFCLKLGLKIYIHNSNDRLVLTYPFSVKDISPRATKFVEREIKELRGRDFRAVRMVKIKDKRGRVRYKKQNVYEIGKCEVYVTKPYWKP